ncbi:MAG: hypothetical protein WBL81_13175, partial [Pseudolabrys sp.]
AGRHRRWLNMASAHEGNTCRLLAWARAKRGLVVVVLALAVLRLSRITDGYQTARPQGPTPGARVLIAGEARHD